MPRLPAILLTLSLLSGCDALSREGRIEHKLEKAGLKPRLARCMAHKLDQKLTDDELAQLAAAARRPREGDGPLTLGALADRLQAIDDPRIMEVVTRAGLGCTILG